MRYGSIYLIVKDFDKSVSFYEKIFDMKVSATNGKRFAQFNNKGLNLCLMNGHYDSENPSQVVIKGEYWEIYDNQSEIANKLRSRRFKGRIQQDKRIGYCSADDQNSIYQCFFAILVFTFMDPDGNPIEITGNYAEEL